MLENNNFNTLINHIVFTTDKLLENKKYPSELSEYLYLIIAGMILSYGDDYIDDIYNMISMIKFTNNKEIIEYTNKNNECLRYINPTEHNYVSKLFDFNCSFPSINFNYELLYKEIDSSSIKTLEYLVHELNYILFNKNKKYSLINSFKIRYDYYRNDVILDNDNSSTFNKVFNVLQSEDIIKNVLRLSCTQIKNEKFSKAINKFKDIDLDLYKFEGLDMLTNLFRPIYNIKENKKFIDESLFYDNDCAEKEFDNVLGRNSYKDVCRNLDKLLTMIANNKNGNNNYYALSVEYVHIRNAFVNKYLSLKLQEI